LFAGSLSEDWSGDEQFYLSLPVDGPVPPLSLAAFTRGFSRLDADSRLEFVAALWAARGWQTRRDGDCLVVRDGDVERRIRVYTPGFFGSPEFDDVDVLVVTDEDESVADAAAAHGVRYVGPIALRDRLLYGMPRDDAEQVAETYFDRSLTTPDTADKSGPGGGRSGLLGRGARLRERLPDSERVLVLVVLLSVVGVAGVGPVLVPSGDASTSVPDANANYTPGTVGAIGSTGSAGVSTENVSGMPPGFSKGEVSDLPTLAAATDAVMEEEGWALRAYRNGPDRTVWRFSGDRWTQSIRAANVTNYRNEVQVNDDDRSIRSEAYSDGETIYRAMDGESGPEYSTQPAGDGGELMGVRSKVRTAIVAYLSTDDTTVSCAGTLENTDECFAYRIAADGKPDLLSDVVQNYSARATVSDTGLVTELDVKYTVPDPENRSERAQVRFGFRFDAHGNVTVSPPAWLSEAVERTGEDGSTPTTSPDVGNATTADPDTSEPTRTEPTRTEPTTTESA
jgi:hypothetical protein